MSEPSFEVEAFEQATVGRHCLRIFIGTGSRVTKVKMENLNIPHRIN